MMATETIFQIVLVVFCSTRTQCYAWALIQNHAHLLLRTGLVPIATVMRRLLTGYAVSFNRKYRRHGQLFQNRYKSILCQEDPLFDINVKKGRKQYRRFVEKGIAEGRKPDLVGGGLLNLQKDSIFRSRPSANLFNAVKRSL